LSDSDTHLARPKRGVDDIKIKIMTAHPASSFGCNGKPALCSDFSRLCCSPSPGAWLLGVIRLSSVHWCSLVTPCESSCCTAGATTIASSAINPQRIDERGSRRGDRPVPAPASGPRCQSPASEQPVGFTRRLGVLICA
jgi:hypothetical protein